MTGIIRPSALTPGCEAEQVFLVVEGFCLVFRLNSHVALFRVGSYRDMMHIAAFCGRLVTPPSTKSQECKSCGGMTVPSQNVLCTLLLHQMPVFYHLSLNLMLPTRKFPSRIYQY
jgi:hypothetical protein